MDRITETRIMKMGRAIKTEADYETAIAEIERLMKLPKAEREEETTADRIEFLALLVDDYEVRNSQITIRKMTAEEMKLNDRLQAELKRLGEIYMERLGSELLPFLMRELASKQ
jgi:antitoxin component HigA of HigAB toxin-antitoxin module